MTFSQFFGDYLASIVSTRTLRRGQLFYNSLRAVRPDLAAKLMSVNLDPFYDDEKLFAAVDFTESEW